MWAKRKRYFEIGFQKQWSFVLISLFNFLRLKKWNAKTLILFSLKETILLWVIYLWNKLFYWLIANYLKNCVTANKVWFNKFINLCSWFSSCDKILFNSNDATALVQRRVWLNVNFATILSQLDKFWYVITRTEPKILSIYSLAQFPELLKTFYVQFVE